MTTDCTYGDKPNVPHNQTHSVFVLLDYGSVIAVHTHSILLWGAMGHKQSKLGKKKGGHRLGGVDGGGGDNAASAAEERLTRQANANNRGGGNRAQTTTNKSTHTTAAPAPAAAATRQNTAPKKTASSSKSPQANPFQTTEEAAARELRANLALQRLEKKGGTGKREGALKAKKGRLEAYAAIDSQHKQRQVNQDQRTSEQIENESKYVNVTDAQKQRIASAYDEVQRSNTVGECDACFRFIEKVVRKMLMNPEEEGVKFRYVCHAHGYGCDSNTAFE